MMPLPTVEFLTRSMLKTSKIWHRPHLGNPPRSCTITHAKSHNVVHNEHPSSRNRKNSTEATWARLKIYKNEMSPRLVQRVPPSRQYNALSVRYCLFCQQKQDMPPLSPRSAYVWPNPSVLRDIPPSFPGLSADLRLRASSASDLLSDRPSDVARRPRDPTVACAADSSTTQPLIHAEMKYQ